MSYVLDALNVHVQENILERVHSSFTLGNFLFGILGLSTPDSKNDLGRPKTSVVFGGVKMTTAQVEEMLGNRNLQIPYVKSEPNDGGYVEDGGVTPTASANAAANFGSAEFRFTHVMEPMTVNKHDLDLARGDNAVRNVADTAMQPVWERFVKRVNQGFWTDTLTSTQQNAKVWPGFLGIDHQLTTNNVFGRVDRSVETALNPLLINASTQLDTAVVDLDLISKVNVGFTDALGASIVGLAGKSANGSGANCWIVPANLYQTLRDQAKGSYTIYNNGIPKTGLAGYRFPIIAIDNSYVVYDPYCPASTMFGLNLETWMVAIQSGHNFKWGGFTDKAKTEQGGEYVLWGNFDFMGMLVCLQPWLNCQITNLTAS